MDKTPKERIVFDEGVYYGDEGSEISIEDITSREGITVEEVLDSYTEEEIFENAMNMMDIDPLLETAEFTSSAIMSAEVAPGAASATVHDVAGVPYEVPADVLNGLKDAVRISDRAATTTLFTSLTIAGWTQKGDESAKASPVSLKAAAKEARESSAALAAHGASTIDLEHEVDNAQKASETLFDADGDR